MEDLKMSKVVIGAIVIFVLAALFTLCSVQSTKFDAKCEELCKVLDSKVSYCSEKKKIAICE